jgi:hypothetical protein
MTCDSTRRELMRHSLLAATAAVLSPALATAAGGAPEAPAGSSTAQDFDFLIGNWNVAHRKLRERLVGSQDWDEFDGSCTLQTLLGGAANVDDNLLDAPGGAYRAASIRAFDAASRNWRIWWLDSRSPQDLGTPVMGSFSDGVGVFVADDSWKGTPVKVRFRWSDITSRSARWEQAFSTDGGKTWEINWVMRFTRAA